MDFWVSDLGPPSLWGPLSPQKALGPEWSLVDKRSSSQSQVVPCPWDFAWTLVPRPGPPHPKKIFSPGALGAGGQEIESPR